MPLSVLQPVKTNKISYSKLLNQHENNFTATDVLSRTCKLIQSTLHSLGKECLQI